MKWILAIILCFVFPPVGILWLVYLCFADWTASSGTSLDNMFAGLTGPQKSDFPSNETHKNAIKSNILSLEAKWRSGEVFSGLFSDHVHLHIENQTWFIEKYVKSCADVGRDPIPELLEDWKNKVKAEEEMFFSIRNMCLKQAEEFKKQILVDLNLGEKRAHIIERFENKIGLVCKVRCENRRWYISFEEHLRALYPNRNHLAHRLMIQNQPNYLSFGFDERSHIKNRDKQKLLH